MLEIVTFAKVFIVIRYERKLGPFEFLHQVHNSVSQAKTRSLFLVCTLCTVCLTEYFLKHYDSEIQNHSYSNWGWVVYDLLAYESFTRFWIIHNTNTNMNYSFILATGNYNMIDQFEFHLGTTDDVQLICIWSMLNLIQYRHGFWHCYDKLEKWIEKEGYFCELPTVRESVGKRMPSFRSGLVAAQLTTGLL